MNKKFLLIIMTVLLVGSGCVRTPEVSISPDKAVNIISESKKKLDELNQERAFEWKELQDGVLRGEQITMKDGWKTRMIIYRFNPRLFQFRLANIKQGKTIRAWRDDFSNAVFIMNGVYFHDDDTPVGSLRIDGTEWSKSEFDGDKSGVFEFDGDPSIIETVKGSPFVHQFSSSAQSYPFLIKDGKAAISKDSHLLARRSFIGTDIHGNVYLGAYPDGDVSLYELGQELSKLSIEWKYVLNLDGGPSTSYVSRVKGAEEIEDGFSAIPNVIIVEPKN